ncbi:succinylglutamate desuccinylase/aspartoacylase family protein [Kiritimatiellota bacterium B12222]|nr:succinylglutamate desuccinylase/aspartoacylase family protein [Kiritimatiellota bacterium B12222]
MSEPSEKPSVAVWGKTHIKPGEKKRIRLEVGESYTGLSVRLPLLVWRGAEPGPAVFISSAVHGDEINGTGTIRELINHPGFKLKKGTLILLPVVNIIGFERHSRYMPDRRDLNRSFPGSETGSLTSRLANLVYTEIISRCDYGIDLHTAAVRRTNFPNVRADMDNPGCRKLAMAFGCEIIVDQSGPDGSFRKCATKAGCPTIILEAGEVWKVEPTYLETALRGITNCLSMLGMTNKAPEPCPEPKVITTTQWVRAGAGGFLQFHVSPGEFVTKGQLLATNAGLLGLEQESMYAPYSGVIIGMSTMPAVSPGDPVLHIAKLQPKEMQKLEKALDDGESDSLENRLREDLATNLHVADIPEESA